MVMEMKGSARTLALDLDGSVYPIQFVDPADAERLSGSLAEGQQVRIQVVADDDTDVEGHALSKSAAAQLTLLGGDDDTEGHAISVHFPTAGDAREFRNRLLVTGAIVGSVTLAGLGAGVALTQAPGIGTAAPGSGTSGQEVSDSWSRMGVPGSAAAANAAADELTDSWQNMGVTGSAGQATADEDQAGNPEDTNAFGAGREFREE